MAPTSNQAWVTEALALLAKGLQPFVQRHMSGSSAGEDWIEDFASSMKRPIASPSVNDPRFLLLVIEQRWKQFSGQFPGSDRKVIRNLVSTLHAERHRWAHYEPITRHDAVLVISGVVKLLKAVDAVEADRAQHLLDGFNLTEKASAKPELATNPQAMRMRSSSRRRVGGNAPVHAWFTANSPLGPVFVAHRDKRVSALRIASNGDLARKPETGLAVSNWGVLDASGFVSFMRDKLGLNAEAEPDPNRDPGLVAQVRAALAAGRTDVPIDFSSVATAPFHQEVLSVTTYIPPGDVRTYKEVAQMAGRPNAHRSASEAMRRNPVPLLIPCHRVVHETFRRTRDVGRWGYGSQMKAKLLASEGVVL